MTANEAATRLRDDAQQFPFSCRDPPASLGEELQIRLSASTTTLSNASGALLVYESRCLHKRLAALASCIC